MLERKTEWFRGQCLEEVKSMTVIKLGGRPYRDLRKDLPFREAAGIGDRVGQIWHHQHVWLEPLRSGRCKEQSDGSVSLLRPRWQPLEGHGEEYGFCPEVPGAVRGQT